MADDRDKTAYDRARNRFNELNPEEQARFLVEATASSLASGIKKASSMLADGIEDTVRRARQQNPGDAPSSKATDSNPDSRASSHDGSNT